MTGQVIDVMVFNHTEIDWEMFELWLDGPVEAMCISKLKEGYSEELSNEIVQAELHNHFRLFDMLEPMLHQPSIFSEQLVCQIDSATRAELISRYYELDETVARELLGRKLSGRLRKDLDEISEKTGVSLKSCRRQFDNIKRIFKVIEETPGSFCSNIVAIFNLPQDMALNYAVIIFIGVHRFETSKKKLSPVTFLQFRTVTQALMQDWSTGVDVDDSGDPVLDRDFFGLLRELKLVQDREKEHRNIFLKHLSRTADKRLVSELESLFKPLNRSILGLGAQLYHNKEIKDIFVNCWEKLVEPLKQQRLSTPQVNQILESYEEILKTAEFQLETELSSIFIRYFSCLKIIISALYSATSGGDTFPDVLQCT